MKPYNVNEQPKPIITAIIPTYRRSQLLRQAINSVLKQTYPHFIVCVYDNASGDDTASVVAEIAKVDPRVKYYCHSENIGGLNNFQYGLKHVETPLFSFLSDDDILLPEFYETALAGFESHPEAMFSVTDVCRVVKGRIMKMPLDALAPGIHYPPSGLAAILEHGCSEWTGILFKKEAAEDVGFLDLEVRGPVDYDFILRLAAHFPFVVTKRPGAVFDGRNWGSPFPYEDIWPGWLKLVRNLTEDKALPMDIRTYAERVLLNRFEKGLFPLGIYYLYRGRAGEAKKVAVLLRDQFHGRRQYFILSAIINTHRYFPFARFVFNSIITLYRYLHLKAMTLHSREHNQQLESNAPRFSKSV